MMATNGGQVAIAELLVNMGADVNITDKVSIFVVKIKITSDYQVNALTTQENKSALVYAKDRGRSAAPLVELLISKGSKSRACFL